MMKKKKKIREVVAPQNMESLGPEKALQTETRENGGKETNNTLTSVIDQEILSDRK